MKQFDEFDSEEEGSEGQEFPSDLEISDEEDQGEDDGSEPSSPQPPSKSSKSAPGPSALAGTKRKAPPKTGKPGAAKKAGRKPRVDVEYEMETEPLSREMLKNW